MRDFVIEGERISIKILSVEDVDENYVEWLNDKEVTRFLESRWKSYSLEDLKEYVKAINESSNDIMFGIYLKENQEHIGNIKIGQINYIHRYADLGFILGQRHWNKGYGTESIKLATEYAFKELNLNKLFAGIYSNNIGSYKAFLKAGYTEAGRLSKHLLFEGSFVDKIIVEKLNPY